MSKVLEALKDLRTIVYQDEYERRMSNWDVESKFKNIESELKRLEKQDEILKIIKSHLHISSVRPAHYTYPDRREDKIEVSISEMYFTEEEFDKIKDAI